MRLLWRHRALFGLNLLPTAFQETSRIILDQISLSEEEEEKHCADDTSRLLYVIAFIDAATLCVCVCVCLPGRVLI